MLTKPKKIKQEDTVKCYSCGKNIEFYNELTYMKFPIATKKGLMEKNRSFHFNCLEGFREKFYNEEVRIKEHSDWEELVEYFKTDMLRLPSEISVDKHSIMRLLGMRVGKYYPSGNNTRILEHGYQFSVILTTLKFVKVKHMKYINSIDFKDGKHKTNMIMKFVSENINMIYSKKMKQEDSNNKLDVEENLFDYKELYATATKSNDEHKTVNVDIKDVDKENDDIELDFENDF